MSLFYYDQLIISPIGAGGTHTDHFVQEKSHMMLERALSCGRAQSLKREVQLNRES